MQRQIPTGRFRRRLTVAFVAVAGIAAGTIGIGAYALVRDARFDDFTARSITDAGANFVALTGSGEELDPSQLRSFMDRVEQRMVDATLIITASGDHSSKPYLSRADVPESLQTSSPQGLSDVPHAETIVQGTRFLVVATPESTAGVRAFFFYSETSLRAGLRDLASIIWRLWLLVIIGAALVGNSLARRTLRPVSHASAAARSLAEGLLDTRLPIEREDEFGAWAVSFNEMAEALETKISQLTSAHERERQFTSDVSHELRTPLSALVTTASMLEAKLDEMDPETRWMSERMISDARRLRDLVNELLEISRLQSGREVVTYSEVDLGLLVASIIENHGWKDVVGFEARSVTFPTDKARAERIIVNLIANAIEHGRKNPKVTIGENPDGAFVEVSDEGPGIPPEHIDQIFERFYKLDPSRAGGSGLGLAIAAENAQLLDGHIAVSSEPGRGSVFLLTLPRPAP